MWRGYFPKSNRDPHGDKLCPSTGSDRFVYSYEAEFTQTLIKIDI